MTNLGLWNTIINQSELRSWYKLPASMEQEWRTYRPDGREMRAWSATAYASLRERTVAFADKSVEHIKPAYHHAGHFRKVEAYGLAAADAWAKAKQCHLPPLVRQVFGLALYAHDAHHCGSTFRAMAPQSIYRPELGRNVSTEWVTALSVNDFMLSAGVNFPARLFQTGVIWSSTYGGNTPLGRQLRLPNPRPATIWGCIMRAADVCPPERFSDWLLAGCAVSYGEVPALPAPQSLDGFITGQSDFTGYIEHCFDRLDEVAGSRLTHHLGWRLRLANIRHGLSMLEAGDKQLLRTLHSETSRYGVRLA